eukprot:6944980-Lingulodinium_polyedra.AAC.1
MAASSFLAPCNQCSGGDPRRVPWKKATWCKNRASRGAWSPGCSSAPLKLGYPETGSQAASTAGHHWIRCSEPASPASQRGHR